MLTDNLLSGFIQISVSIPTVCHSAATQLSWLFLLL